MSSPRQKGKVVGIIIGVAAVVVLVIGVGGFVWPGFFTSSSPESVAQSFADAFKDNDNHAALRLVCPAQQDNRGIVDLSGAHLLWEFPPQVVGEVRTITTMTTIAQVQGKATVTGSTAKVTVYVQGVAHFADRGGLAQLQFPDLHYNRDDTLTLRQQNGTWCVSKVGYGKQLR